MSLIKDLLVIAAGFVGRRSYDYGSKFERRADSHLRAGGIREWTGGTKRCTGHNPKPPGIYRQSREGFLSGFSGGVGP